MENVNTPGFKHFQLLCRARHERCNVHSSSGPLTAFAERIATKCEDDASELLAHDPTRVVSAGEAVPTREESWASGDDMTLWCAKDTLKRPSAITSEASFQRQRQLMECGIYEQGIDAAESVEARNSLEKMLTHQMTLAHDLAFNFASKAKAEKSTIESARLLNASARMMKTFQDGILAVQKIRTGGKQTVTVQHVNVSEGGQAVVAGKMGVGSGEVGKQ